METFKNAGLQLAELLLQCEEQRGVMCGFFKTYLPLSIIDVNYNNALNLELIRCYLYFIFFIGA